MFDKEFIYDTTGTFDYLRSEEIYSTVFENIISKLREETLRERPFFKGRELIGFHKAFIEIGNALLDYLRIDDNVTQMTEASYKFYHLGKHVMHLCLKFEEDGIIQEECCWLGIGSEMKYKEGWVLRLEPSGKLVSFDWIKELKEEELGSLYSQYLKGKVSYVIESKNIKYIKNAPIG